MPSLPFHLLSLLLFSALLAVGCSGDDDHMLLPEEPEIDFGGITRTDENGAPAGSPDPTDWRLDDAWSAREQQLFGGTALELCGNKAAKAFPASPNPAGASLLLRFANVENYQLELRLVDKRYGLLERLGPFDYLGFPPHFLAIDLDQLDIPVDTFRIYYRLRFAGCELRGHGDVVRR